MSTFGIEIDSKDLKTQYSDNENFDPDGFFFVTYRSNTIGSWLVFPKDDGKYWISFLWADQTYREKNLEQCLVGLAIEYMNQNNSKVKELYITPYDDFQRNVLTSMGFKEV